MKQLLFLVLLLVTANTYALDCSAPDSCVNATGMNWQLPTTSVSGDPLTGNLAITGGEMRCARPIEYDVNNDPLTWTSFPPVILDTVTTQVLFINIFTSTSTTAIRCSIRYKNMSDGINEDWAEFGNIVEFNRVDLGGGSARYLKLAPPPAINNTPSPVQTLEVF